MPTLSLQDRRIVTFYAFVTLASVQFTDLKVAGLKFGDVASLAMIGSIYFYAQRRRQDRVYVLMALAFTFTFVTSIFKVPYLDEEYMPPINSLLKEPGWLSLARYIQLIGCVAFAATLHSILVVREERALFLRVLDKGMRAFAAFWIPFGLLGAVGLDVPFAPGGRLVGGYVEGGPFGLMYAFYLAFAMIFYRINLTGVLLFGAVIVLAQAKSGILFLISIFVFTALVDIQKAPKRIFFVIVAGILVVPVAGYYFDFYGKIQGYLDDVNRIEEELAERPNDPSLVQGRIAGSFIGPEIVKANPIFGVGLGNYSLVRNVPEYRGIFPIVEAWDLGGMGGILMYTIEGGFVGLSLFLAALFIFIGSAGRKSLAFTSVVLFLSTQVFGVQLYFQYIWLALAAATSFPRARVARTPIWRPGNPAPDLRVSTLVMRAAAEARKALRPGE